MLAFESHHKAATEALQPWIAGRFGFGAFRHYRSLRWESIRRARESYYLLGSKEHCDECGWHRHHDEWRLHIEWLLSIDNYRSRPIWALFWALSKAEHGFLQKYTKAWSHEERLTGHLITRIIDRIEEFAPVWQLLSGDDPGSRCDVWYSDLSTNCMEKVTGADFGIVFHIALPGLGEFFKVARFQAKKMQAKGTFRGNDSIAFRVDEKQFDILNSRPDLCYYVVYDRYDEKEFCVNPLISSTNNLYRTEPGADNQTMSGQVASNSYVDLAFFLAFELADRASASGCLVRDENEARNMLLWGVQGGDWQPMDRVLVITLGSPPRSIDWDDVFHSKER